MLCERLSVNWLSGLGMNPTGSRVKRGNADSHMLLKSNAKVFIISDVCGISHHRGEGIDNKPLSPVRTGQDNPP